MTQKIKLYTLSLFLGCFSMSVIAQMTPRRPDRKKASGLMADNVSIVKQAQRLDSAIARLLAEDALNELDSPELDFDNPASDLYQGAWNTNKVNGDRADLSNVPDSVNFNCRGYVHPIMGELTSVFGPRRYRYHYGVDIKLNIGDSIGSAFNGKVRVAGYDRGGYGNYVVVRHDNGLETVYGHLSKILAFENQVVHAGQTIGLGGNTGRSTGPHLHFETRFLGNPINPEDIIDFDAGETISKDFFMVKAEAFDYVKVAGRTSHYYSQYADVKYHRVKRGETLSSIAQKHGTTITRLCKLNGISRKKSIRVGQRLKY